MYYKKSKAKCSSLRFNKFLALCLVQDRHDYACIACLKYYTGIKLSDCFKIDTIQASVAAETGMLTIKNKFGIKRNFEINESIKIGFAKMLGVTQAGQKIFIAANDKRKLAVKKFRNFAVQQGGNFDVQ